MVDLYFSDVLKKANIQPEDVKLIRHALSDKGFRSCYQDGKIVEYTSLQKPNFSKGYKYWAVFISDSGNYARFYGLFRVGKHVPDTPEIVQDGFPHPEWFKGESAYYELTLVDELTVFRDRLLIDWGPSTKMWHQKGTTEKRIIALKSDPTKVFPGFDSVLLDYHSLKEVFDNPFLYSDWKVALSAVKAVYLISDNHDGRLYVGSAYGKDGLWGRWNEYVTTGGHGNNKYLEATIKAFPDRIEQLRWSVLQILPKNATAEIVINTENQWKNKLLTREHGYNKSELSWEQEQFLLNSIALLQRINDTPELHDWCCHYNVYDSIPDTYGLEHRIYSEFTKGAYDYQFVPHDYVDTLNSAKIDRKEIYSPGIEWLASLSTNELIACIAYHFRYDYNENGSLIFESIASGAMLKLLLELQKRR